jgi:hypothetical protein
MEKKWLDEYEAEEWERAKKAMERAGDYLIACRENLLKPDLKDLIQMFFNDKVEFEKTYAFHDGSIPFGLLLTYHKQVVTLVPPYREGGFLVEGLGLGSMEAKKAVGLLAGKFKGKRVVPILDLPSSYIGLSYLDPLLEKKPPTGVRLKAFRSMISGEKVKYFEEEGKAIFKNRLPEDFDIESLGFAPRIELYDVLAECFSDLRVLKLDGLANLVKGASEEHPSVAAMMSILYSILFTRPILDGLCGSPQYERDDKILHDAKELGMLPNEIDFSFFPVEIGKVIADAFNIGFPVNPSEEAIDKLYSDRAIEKARVLLETFESYIREEKGDDAIGKEDELRHAFLEASEAIPTVDREFEKLNYRIGNAWFGFFGLLSLLSPDTNVKIAGFLANLGYKLSESRITQKVLPKVLGLKFGPLPVAVWDFERTYKQVEEYERSLQKRKKRLKGQTLSPRPSFT